MPEFRYRAVTGQGHPVEGTRESSCARDCVAMLREEGLRVSEVTPVERSSGRLAYRGALTWTDLDLLNTQLQAIARSGLPMPESLRALSVDIKRQKLGDAVRRLANRLDQGTSLADAMDVEPKMFPRVYRSLIRAGEQTGNLPGVLQQLCSYAESRISFTYRLREVLAYPATVFVVMLGVMFYALGFVMPEYLTFYQSFGKVRFPLGSAWMARASVALHNQTGSVVVGMIGFVGLVVFLYLIARQHRVISPTVSRLFRWIPVLGRRQQAIAAARFSETLGLLLASGAQAIESIELAGEAADNPLLHRLTYEVKADIANGRALSESLAAMGFFDNTYAWVLSSAERTGTLPEALRDISRDYAREVTRQDNKILAMLSPMLVCMMGVLVALMIISLYGPLLGIGEIISK